MEDSNVWYLMKNEDKSVFGPLPLAQLRTWANEAQISPLDRISHDERNWQKAPMVPELEMDYLVEVSPDQYYGPTTLGALKEFFTVGEIRRDTVVTNCKDGTQRRVAEIPELVPQQVAETTKPERTTIRQSLQARIRELEEMLLDERRAREAAESLVERLQARL